MDHREPEGQRIHLKNTPTQVEEFQDLEKKHSKNFSVIGLLAIALIVLFFLSLVFIVPYDQFAFTPSWIFTHVQDRFTQFYLIISGKNDEFLKVFCQYIAVMLAGCALSVTGGVFKGSFKNVLAGPSTMGVMSGGTLGALVYILLFTVSETQAEEGKTAALAEYASHSIIEAYGTQLFILVGSFLAVGLVMGIALAAGRGKVSGTAMIMSGTVLSSLTSSVFMMVQYYMILTDPSDTRIETLQDLMMGSFNNIENFLDIALFGIPIIVCIVICMSVSGRLNLLSLGEDEARSMGIDTGFYRNMMIIVGTVLTAIVIAFCGRIGFLGFMVPMVARKLVGPDMKKLIPCSALIGALMLTVVFDVAYICGLTDYMNLFTSSIGGIVMVIVIMRKGGKPDAVKQGPAAGNMGIR